MNTLGAGDGVQIGGAGEPIRAEVRGGCVVAAGAGVVTATAGVLAGAFGLGEVVPDVVVPAHAVAAIPNIARPRRNFLTHLLLSYQMGFMAQTFNPECDWLSSSYPVVPVFS